MNSSISAKNHWKQCPTDEMIYEKTFIMAQASSSESPMFMADLVRFMLDIGGEMDEFELGIT